jgi:hypothetical protein
MLIVAADRPEMNLRSTEQRRPRPTSPVHGALPGSTAIHRRAVFIAVRSPPSLDTLVVAVDRPEMNLRATEQRRPRPTSPIHGALPGSTAIHRRAVFIAVRSSSLDTLVVAADRPEMNLRATEQRRPRPTSPIHGAPPGSTAIHRRAVWLALPDDSPRPAMLVVAADRPEMNLRSTQQRRLKPTSPIHGALLGSTAIDRRAVLHCRTIRRVQPCSSSRQTARR